jgi:hypothetical protein
MISLLDRYHQKLFIAALQWRRIRQAVGAIAAEVLQALPDPAIWH